MKLCAQTYTVRDYLKTQEDIVNSLKKIKQIGYNAIQISGFCDCDFNWLKNVLHSLDISVCATHIPVERIVNDTQNVINEHKLLNIPYVGIGYIPIFSIAECDEFCKKIAPAVKQIKNSGLKLLCHNHAHEFIKENGQLLIDRLLNSFSEEELGLIADFYWVQRAGYSPEKFIKKYANRTPIVHFKDMRSVKDLQNEFQYAEVFEGNMDYESIYNACLKAGVKWVAIEQDSCKGDPFD